MMKFRLLKYSQEKKWLTAVAIGGFTVACLGLFSLTRESPNQVGIYVVQIEPSWQQCSSSSKCVLLHYGCSVTSVTEENFSNAKAKLWKMAGNPAVMNCSGTLPPVTPKCANSACVVDFGK